MTWLGRRRAMRPITGLVGILAWLPKMGLGQSIAPSGKADRDMSGVAARAVVDILAQGCAPRLGRPDALEQFARSHHFDLATDEVRPLLQQLSHGPAWVFRSREVDLAMVWTTDALQCRVVARIADREAARRYFRDVMEGARRPGISIRQEIDRAGGEGGRRFSQIGYVGQNDANPADVSRTFVLTTFSAPDAPFAVIATVAATQRQ